MKNKSHPLLHGYYLTRFPKPDEKEMNMSLEKARKMEQDFFIGNNMWNKIHRNRLGSPKLADALSRLLSQMIEELSEPFRLSGSNSDQAPNPQRESLRRHAISSSRIAMLAKIARRQSSSRAVDSLHGVHQGSGGFCKWAKASSANGETVFSATLSAPLSHSAGSDHSNPPES